MKSRHKENGIPALDFVFFFSLQLPVGVVDED